MDLEKFKEDLACALGRPEEWRFDAESRFLIHTSSDIRVYAHGQVYRNATTTNPYHLICNTSQKTVNRCWTAVFKREAEARHKNEVRDRKAFLDSFSGFRS